MSNAPLSPHAANHAGSVTAPPDPRWQAVLRRDSTQNGQWFYAVASTGVFCRPDCPSRRPRRENVTFFSTIAEAEQAGFRPCLRCHPRLPHPHLAVVEKISTLIKARLENPPTLAELALETGLSPFHLQRLFKKATGATPREYAANCRLLAMKENLQSGRDVTQSLFDAGFGSTSRVYENSNSRLGMTPATYGRKGRGARIRYATAECSLGRSLVASTELGVCAILFGDSEDELVTALKAEFSEAELANDPASLRPALDAVVQHLRDSSISLNLPLDIRATAFQLRVWKHLQTIPPGATQSYAQAAAALGVPSAARAVARACATNNVAVAIPCHRIVRQDGALGGYRWGLKRKEQLLAAERKSGVAPTKKPSR